MLTTGLRIRVSLCFASRELMFFHLILTPECNLNCRYCSDEAADDFNTNFEGLEVDYSLPQKISYNISDLYKFCEQDPDCVLTFYGGEPLLRIGDIKKIMDNVKAKHFMIQTNGLLLDQLEPEYVNRFHTILVSVDGNEVLTDFYRGNGTFRKVIDNLKLVKHNGFGGELIARMTVMEQTELCKQVKWLLGNNEFSFSSVHWQLNAGFWTSDYANRNFKEWSQKAYNKEVRKLVDFWVDTMEKTSTVLRLYPFLGIAQSLFKPGTKNLLRCGAGWINYAVQTDGYIVPCPNMWGMRNYYLGHLASSKPTSLKTVFVGDPCTECGVMNVCGGRCLYANITKRWSQEAYGSVCDTVRNLHASITEELPRIKELIETKKISCEDFDYVKYNGCEIIP